MLLFFKAETTTYCGQSPHAKIQGYLPYCGIGLNQDSCKYTYGNHNPCELSSPMSNERKQRGSFSKGSLLSWRGQLG
jgi:hypothetical protein